MKENQEDSAKNNFFKYLDSLGLSPKSHKNYRSDLTHFIGWVILKIRSFGSYVETLTEAVPFLNSHMAVEYKNYMIENSIPSKTINRRLSTLRHLSRFLASSQIIDLDFMNEIENVSLRKTTVATHPAVKNFQSYLEAKNVSKNTVKNYVSDVRQFLTWLEINNQQSTTNN